jgi:transcriptional regulator with XRE-family HTH domain
MNEFRDWLLQEMKSRNWGIPELSRIAHVSRGAIGNVLRGERKPGPDLCKAFAHAFKIPPEIVFRKAGLLPPVPGENQKVEEINEITRQLIEPGQDDLLQYARLRLRIQEDRGQYRTGEEPRRDNEEDKLSTNK